MAFKVGNMDKQLDRFEKLVNGLDKYLTIMQSYGATNEEDKKTLQELQTPSKKQL